MYDSIRGKIYKGNFSKGLYDGYGIAYDSLGNEIKHVWAKGGLYKATATLYNNLYAHSGNLSDIQINKIENRILRWERYYIWMYIGWRVFAALFLLLCVGASEENDVSERYNRAKPWNKYLIWLDWLFFGWLGAHRYALKSKVGLIYPVLLVCLLIANIREASIYLFYPSTWCLWNIGSFTYMCLGVTAAFLIFDFFWIPWRCYVLNHSYYRHDKNEKDIILRRVTPIMAFGNSVRSVATHEANVLTNVLGEIKSIHNRKFEGKTGFWTRLGRAFSGNDPWLDFERKRARDIQNCAKRAEKAQNNYAELCETLNKTLEESRANAYRNFTLAKELIAKAIAARGKEQELVKDIAMNTDKLSVSVSIDSITEIQSGIDWNATTDSAIKCSTQLMSMGMKGPWAIGIGVGASLLSAALDSINAAQKACEEANQQCAEAISQLGTICNAITKSQASILRSGEIIVALNKANEAFWLAYKDLRDMVFTEEPSFNQFIFGTKVSEDVASNSDFRNRIMHLAQVCSEYNKINKAKL